MNTDYVTAINRPEDTWNAHAPHTSLIIACYRVGAYLPAFFRSLELQSADHSGYELIFVIDGCPEDSEALVRSWMSTTSYAVRIIVKPNGGVASARNIGLSVARGDWVTHPDPDDVLDKNYFEEIEDARASYPSETMFAARAVLMAPDGTELGHTLDRRYRGASTSLVDLEAEPRKIHTLGGVVFFKRSVIEQHQLSFDPRILQSSDTDFIGHYLLCNYARYVLVPGARYLYFRREDGSSIVSTHSANVSRYPALFGISHRNMLERAGDDCPRWLGNLLLYFVFMLFRRDRRPHSPVSLASSEELLRISALLRSNLARIGPQNIQAFDLFTVPTEVRMAWLAASGGLLATPVERLRIDQAEGTAKLALYSASPRHISDLGPRGKHSRLLNYKIRRVDFLGETWVYQHILRVKAPASRTLRLTCLNDDVLSFEGKALTRGALDKRYGRQSAIIIVPGQTPPPEVPKRELRRRMGVIRKADKLAGRSLKPTWVFITDDTWGGMQLETLGLRLSSRKTHVDAIFVAGTDSATIRRAKDLGLPTVAPGTAAHLAAMRRAQVVFTTRGSKLASNPFPWATLDRHWLNVLVPEHPLSRSDFRNSAFDRADLVLCSSALERDRLVGPYSRFPFTRDEVVLTGLPCHDLLHSDEDSRAVSIAPSWRSTLRLPDSQSSRDDAVVLAQLRETRFVQAWSELFTSAAFAEACSGREVCLLLPSQAPSQLFDVPPWIEIARTPSEHVAALNRSAVLLTDYSPHDHDAAFLGRPSVYFQFDRDEVLGAPDSPLAQAAAFRDDGFGPVVETVEQAAKELALQLHPKTADHTIDELSTSPRSNYESRRIMRRVHTAFEFTAARGACDRVIDVVAERIAGRDENRHAQ